MLEKIKKVINELSLRYPDLFIDYEYIDGCYEIWHNSFEKETKKNFNEFVGGLIYKHLYTNGFYNFFIGYNESKTKELEYLKDSTLDVTIDYFKSFDTVIEYNIIDDICEYESKWCYPCAA